MRVRVGVGAGSGTELARRSAEALADRLGQTATVFPSHHAGFMEDLHGIRCGHPRSSGGPLAGARRAG